MFRGVGQVEEGGERGVVVKTCRNSYVSGSGTGGGGWTWGRGGRGTLFAGKSILKFS